MHTHPVGACRCRSNTSVAWAVRQDRIITAAQGACAQQVARTAASGTEDSTNKHRVWKRADQQQQEQQQRRALANKLRNCSKEEQLVQQLTAAPASLLDSINAARAVVSYANIRAARLATTSAAQADAPASKESHGRGAATGASEAAPDHAAWPHIYKLLKINASLMPMKEAADAAWALGKLRQLAAAASQGDSSLRMGTRKQRPSQDAQHEHQQQQQYDEQLAELLCTVLDRVHAILGAQQQQAQQQQQVVSGDGKMRHAGQQLQLHTGAALTLPLGQRASSAMTLASAAKVLWAATQLPTAMQQPLCQSLVPQLLQACEHLLAACSQQRSSTRDRNSQSDKDASTDGPLNITPAISGTTTGASATLLQQQPHAGQQSVIKGAASIKAKNLAIIAYSLAELSHSTYQHQHNEGHNDHAANPRADGTEGNNGIRGASTQHWLELWLPAFIGCADHATAQGMAMATWAVARLQFLPTPASFQSLQTFAVQHMLAMTPQGVAMTVWGLGSLHAYITGHSQFDACEALPTPTAAASPVQHAPSAAGFTEHVLVPVTPTASSKRKSRVMQLRRQYSKLMLNKQQLDVVARQLQLQAPAMTPQEALQALHGVALLARASSSQALPFTAHNLLQRIPLQFSQQRPAHNKGKAGRAVQHLSRSRDNTTAAGQHGRQAVGTAMTPSELSSMLWDVAVLGHFPSASWLKEFWTAVQLQLQQQQAVSSAPYAMLNDQGQSLTGTATFTVRDAAQLLWAAAQLRQSGKAHDITLADVVPLLLSTCVQGLPDQIRSRRVVQTASDLSYCAWGAAKALGDDMRHCLPLWFIDLSVEAACAAANLPSETGMRTSAATTSVLRPMVVCRLLSVLAWLQYLPPSFDQFVEIVASAGFAQQCTPAHQRQVVKALEVLQGPLTERVELK